MLWNRKGAMEWDLIVTMAIFAVVTLVVIVILTKFIWGVNDTFSDRETCRLSVLGHQATTYQVAGKTVTPEIISIDCKRRELTVFKDHVELYGQKIAFYDGKEGKLVKKYDEVTPDVLNALVADEMAGCWYQFLEGKNDFIDKVTIDWGNNNKRCFICSEISFDKEGFVAIPESEQRQFLDSLDGAKVRKGFLTPGDKDAGKTVRDYLFNDDAFCADYYYSWKGTADQPVTPSMPCTEKYLAFWSNKEGKWGEAFKNLLFGGGATTPSGKPFLSNEIRLTPQTPRDQYLILFVVEGGSWWQTSVDPENVFSDAFAIITRANRDAERPRQKTTYAVWVLPANGLNPALCEEYFA